MNAHELMEEFRKSSVQLELAEGKIKYRAPAGAMTAEFLQHLKRNKEEIIGLLSSGQVQGRYILPFKRDQHQAPPLSFAQQRLWFIDQLSPGSASYNVPLALRLLGQLNIDALRASVNEIVRRHEALRTSFASAGDGPLQRIAASLSLPMVLADLSSLPQDQRDAQAQALVQAEIGTPFDLAAGPLVRAGLVRLSASEHLFLVTFHHIVSDGWSVGIFIRELAALYAAFVDGRPSPLPELAIQYADFAHWQRQWLTGDVLGGQLAYWKNKLAGAPELLALPTDRPRPPVQTHRGAACSFAIPAAAAGGLHALGKAAQATLFMTLAAAFNVLLSRYSGQDDICIGTPIANRNRAEVEPLIGFFVNTLVLRTQVDPQASFLDLLAQVRTTALGAYAHQDVPFEQLIETLNPERQGSYSPLFQVMFSVQSGSAGELALPGLTLGTMAAEHASAKFDLTLTVNDEGEQMTGGFEYNTDLFDGATIARMAQHFTQLLSAVAAHPAAPLGQLQLLGEAERELMLVQWNDTGTDYPDRSTVHGLFEAQAAKAPQSVAVAFGEQQLSYGELNARANALAHHLRTLGVGPDVLVGICVERSLDMIVGLLAILKAGGAYLPLDPSYPAERLAYMLEDAAPRALLTHAHLLGRLPDAGIATVCMDRDSAAIGAHGQHNPEPLGLPDSLAYVIYTSGSTGRPKGVTVFHRAVSRLVFDTAYIRLQPSDTVAQAASNAFDATTFEVWGALLHGCRLCLVDPDLVMSPPAFAAEIARQGISVLFITTALFNQFALQAPAAFANMRYILFGGEAVTPSLVEVVLNEGAPAHLVHVYGPTETTTFALAHHVDRHARGLKGLAIGKPIGGTQAYVLDAAGHPVPTGVSGELHLGGDGVARGYLKRPDLTAEKFIPNPFGAPGSRMYRTGDLVRYLADGSIDYLGRIDTQVKIRGFRIEPGEIEAALAALAGVREALVLAREDAPGDKRLAAYLVWEQGAAPLDASALRTALLAGLPDYMVPSHFMALEQFPITPNGKIDRRALPAPDTSADHGGYVAARTPTEEILAGIWRAVLKRDRVGVEDNFFALGGHSLLATQVMSKVRTAFDIELALRAVFEAPTIAQLAVLVERAGQERAGVRVPAIAALARGDELAPLSFAQQRLWFIDQLDPGQSFYNMPMALRLTGQLDEAALRRALNEIVRRHEALRTTFVMDDGVARQKIAASLELAVPLADLSALSPSEREARAQGLLQYMAQAPFDLASGPLVRASMVRLAPAEHLFLVTFHHIVSDGWSMGVFIGELAALYGAFAQGQPSPLPQLAVQYADFAHWQRQWLGGAELERQLGYWKNALAGAPPLLALPTDRPRPPLQSHRGAVLDFAIEGATVAGLQALNQGAHATMFMTLAAAFNVLLARYSGQDDICIGTPIANRNRSEVEPLIGFFVNTLVLRTTVDAGASFQELLARVRTAALGAYAHQDVPFEQLIEAVNPERQGSYAPLFQVMFSMHSGGAGALELAGLQLATVGAEHSTAKFDLTLNVSEADGQMMGSFEYSSDLFDRCTIERMAQHFTQLLAAVVAQPQAAIGSLQLLGERERAQLLVAWNDTAAAYPPADTMHALFEAQAKRDPQALAVVFEEDALTYGELDARANRLAHHLQHLGVGPDVLVGICVERSLEMIVGLMAILKAGGAYVPLDPSYPPERLAFMLEDAAPAVLLTQQHLAGALPAIAGATFCIDSGWDHLARYGDHPPLAAVLPEHLAYVIYTSGSTGKPKGAMLRHRGLCNLVGAQIIAARVTPGQRMLQFASFNFDASTWEIFITLGSGATLCMAARDALMPGNLEATLQGLNINMALLPPVVLATLTEAPLPQLNTIVSGGEACSAALANAWAAKARFFNAYGPTEATVYATVAHCEPGLQAVAPIGRPIANTQIYILDAALNPVPVGVAGELHIAGDGLARGYLKRPDLTAAMFVPNPFGAPGSRMYKSGDLARYLPDGNIEYLGRADTQVKLRGFRIELGEIEAALAAVGGVREALVLAREDVAGDKRLAAYLIWEEGAAALDSAALRAILLASLPDYMVPAHFIALAQFPLTPNGKVDRRALPAPDNSLAASGYVAPRTPTEEILAGIWAGLLGRDQVGVNDNFFAIGGHSLLATQVLSKVRTAFDIDLPLRAIFESPTVGQLAEAVEAARLAGSGIRIPAIVPRLRDGALAPLSFAQQRLWFVDQFDPGKPFYNIPLTLRLSGQLNEQALRAAVSEIVRRHEALRTTFTSVDGEPRQRIAAPQPVPFALADLSAVPAEEREAQGQALVEQEARTPFDLACGPLLRASLVTLGAGEHLLTVTFHHIVSDGWSVGVYLRELAALYAAFSQGLPSPLPELAIQYADFACWQRQWLSGDVLEQQLAYWRGQMAGAPALLALPHDLPRPPVQTHRGDVVDFGIAPETVAGLRALNQVAQTTMFMTLAAAFTVLLARYSGQDDICIGTPIANRNRPETEALIGFFVNTLVLRTQIDPQSSFMDVLAASRAVALGAYANQDVPFEQLIETLNPERQASYSPLFQVMFTMQSGQQRGELVLPGLTLGGVAAEHTTALFDLTLSVSEGADQFGASFEYNVDLFERATVERMARHFQQLLAAIVRDPSSKVAELGLLHADERAMQLSSWNGTAAPYPRELTIHQLIEAQVRRTPQAPAVLCGGEQLSYAELNARANQLAHHLRALGAGPDAIVGVCVERSLEMVVALLAVLKSGAAYLPLDPAYPADRLAYMLEDAAPAVLLTHSRVQQVAAAGVPVVHLDSAAQDLAGCSQDNPDQAGMPDSLAYVIYTSGSTGKPKGVLNTHRNAVNYIASHIRICALGAADRQLQFASINFDVSVEEIFPPLAAGAALVLRPVEFIGAGQAFSDFIAQHGITAASLPTAFWHMWTHEIDSGGASLPPCLRTLVVGGEKASLDKYAAWSRQDGAAAVRWLNAYGPTEATISCTLFEGYPGAECLPDLPIGRPLSNMRAYILDAALEPVPAGVAGELYVAGEGLARGYLKRPDATAGAFIPDPFGAHGARMYRTGDLARYRAGGMIEYLGRADEQVKIRGFRIEPGEIEAALAALPGVAETLVMAREDVAGDKRLAAYVVWKAGAVQLDGAALRAALLRTMPDYMVPSYFIALAHFPMTPNDKVDRRALPAPDTSRSDSGYAPPRTATETVLAGIWADVLKLDKVGIHDNFFALGGHSLLSIRIYKGIENALGVSLPVGTVFTSSTVAEMAQVIDAGAGQVQGQVVTLQPGPGLPHLFCIHPIGGQVYQYQALAQTLAGRMQVHGIQSAGDAPEGERLAELAERYAALIESVQPQGACRLAGWSSGGLFALATAHALERRGRTVSHVSLVDTMLHAAAASNPEAEAVAAILGAVRGRDVSALELAAVGGEMEGMGLSIGNIFDAEHFASLSPRLSAWMEKEVSVDEVAELGLRARVMREHLAMLDEYCPSELKARVQLIMAKHTVSMFEAQGVTVASLLQKVTVKTMPYTMVDGAHHSVLSMPYVQVLGDTLLIAMQSE